MDGAISLHVKATLRVEQETGNTAIHRRATSATGRNRIDRRALPILRSHILNLSFLPIETSLRDLRVLRGEFPSPCFGNAIVIGLSIERRVKNGHIRLWPDFPKTAEAEHEF